MGKPVNWACWVWKDEVGVRYVGVGPFRDAHPALLKWRGRFENESPLNLWLTGFIAEPERVVCGATIMPRKLARKLAEIYRHRHASTILSAREHEGGGTGRRVSYWAGDLEEEVKTFPSVRKAAEWAGINASTVTRRCSSEKSPEWAYVVEDLA